jgi:epoxyqueuosine reductase
MHDLGFMVGSKYSHMMILPFSDTVFIYRTMSVKHLEDMQQYMDTLRERGLFSKNKVFRSYVESKSFRLPDSFQDAKSIIALAVYIPLARVRVPYKGSVHEVLIPPNYQAQRFSNEQLRTSIAKKVIREEGCRIEDVRNSLFLKHLAVRSGLAKYGKNNICYTEEMGSMFSLFAFYTDYVFDEDHWTDLQMMESCKDCRLCSIRCPTHAITDDCFVIDVEKCLPLYNEVRGKIPAWMPKQAHNALIGCMRCQLDCPANKEVVSNAIQCEQLTEQETAAILEEEDNDDIIRALCHKLNVSTPDSVAQDLPVFSRNLKLVLNSD